MKKIIFLLLASVMSVCILCAQGTVETKVRCYFFSDKINLSDLYDTPVGKAKIGTIPQNTTLNVIANDTIRNIFLQVAYKNKTGWVHRNILKEKYVVGYPLKLGEVVLNGESVGNISETTDMYSDDRIKVLWLKIADRIEFILENKTDNSISINWDKSSFIGIDKRAEKFMHSGVSYVNKESASLDKMIPSNAKIEDFIIPNSNVYLDENSQLTIKPLYVYFAKCDYDLNTLQDISGSIRVILVLRENDKELEYEFTFHLSEPVMKEA